MKNKFNYKQETVNILKELVKKYPNQLLSMHLTLALDDYANFDGLSDKEIYFLFEKYKCEKELDFGHNSKDIDFIVKDAMNLNIEELEDDEDF